jgi:hypothetical protein
LPSGTVGTAYSQVITASGGTGPYTFSGAGVIPVGLGLSNSGTLSGTPMTAQTVTVAIRATDANGCFGWLTTPVLISPTPVHPCPTIVLSPQTLTNGTVGTAYSQTFAASGGSSPYTFTASGLPSGLALSSGGVLSGTPTASGSSSVTVTATDTNGCPGSVTTTLTVQAAPPVVITLSPGALPGGTVSTPYSQQMSATGGASPYTFALTSGTLPTGLSLSSSGLISGTPSLAITAPITIRATDSHGATGSLATTLSTVASGSLRVIAQTDITYKGCFLMPPGTDTTFAAGNLSGRMIGGQVHLFVYGNNPTLHDPVYEIIDPGSGYSLDYHTAPKATLYANWGDIYHGKRISFDGSGNPVQLGQQYPSGLYWNDATQLLYWTYADSYNVSGTPNWGLGASQLIDPVAGTSYAYGPWRTKATDADGAVWYGPWRTLYLWTNPLDGTLCCGSTIQSGDVSSPWGPDFYGGVAWPTATTLGGPSPANDLVLPTRYLESYFMANPSGANRLNADGSVHGALRSFRRRLDNALYEGFAGHQPSSVNPALNGGVGSWTLVDGVSGGIWLQLTNVRGVLFSMVLAGAVSQSPTDPLAGHAWYSNAGVNPPVGACAHGIPPPVDITGGVTTAAFPALAIYNPSDLLAVANTANDYTPEPTSVINLEATFGVQTPPVTKVGAGKNLSGFYFDPVRKYLFCVTLRVDDTQGSDAVLSIIHVFAINDVP